MHCKKSQKPFDFLRDHHLSVTEILGMEQVRLE